MMNKFNATICRKIHIKQLNFMYKISISGHFGSKTVASKHCVIVISLGQKYHEGEIFLESLKKITSMFTDVSILIADTLQRHNHDMTNENLSGDALKAHYEALGDAWLDRNQTALLQCNISANKIFR